MNVHRDVQAQQLLAHGGRGLPLVLVGESVQARATAAELLDLQDLERRRADGEEPPAP